MNQEKTCCVTGHRDIPAEQMDRIQELLRREILAELRIRGLAPASVEGLSRERPGAAAAEEAVQEETV